MTHYVPVNDVSPVGLKETVSGYAKLETALAQLAAATTDAGRATAQQAVANARDVDAKVMSAGTTPARSATALLPAHRGRQPRTYPSVTPSRASVSFVWSDSAPSDVQRGNLDGLLARVARLGHSSTLVACRIDDDPRVPDYRPDVDGSIQLRTIGAGQLAALERRFERHRASAPRSLPSTMTPYRRVDAAMDGSRAAVSSVTAGEWFVFEQIDGPRLDTRAGLSIARAVRGALLSALRDDIPPLLSGHQADGRPVDEPHVAIVPLPFVGHRHASGIVLGFAVQLPRASTLLAARDDVLRAIGRWEGADDDRRAILRTDRGARMSFARVRSARLRTLQRLSWAGPSKTWVTATPIALDRHPGELFPDDPARATRARRHVEQTLARACRYVELPPPTQIEISRSPMITGTQPAHRYLPLVQGPRPIRRELVHARLVFDVQVEGPVLLGAGRYLGYGLLQPESGQR